MHVQIRLAQKTELNEIIQLLKDSARWLQINEIDQWSYLLSGGEDDEIELAILKNETYVVEYDNRIIGTFTISSNQSKWDLEIWGKKEDRSLYLHRLAVRNEFKGNGLGYKMIRWIEEKFSDQFTYLRLDCVANNQKLNKFYEAYGFTFFGSIDEFNKYEKRLSEMM